MESRRLWETCQVTQSGHLNPRELHKATAYSRCLSIVRLDCGPKIDTGIETRKLFRILKDSCKFSLKHLKRVLSTLKESSKVICKEEGFLEINNCFKLYYQTVLSYVQDI